MITRDDLKIVNNIRKKREAIRKQLKRRRNPVQGQERDELIKLYYSLEKDEIRAEEKIIALSEMLDSWRAREAFIDVFAYGRKKREIAGWMNLSEQYVGRIVKAAIEELNKKGVASKAAPADH